MAIDSTAELLFNIGANSEDAEANIQRFRALMGTDLEEMAAQFSGWADEVLGNIGTVQGAMTAGFSVMAAGLLAVGAAMGEADKEYDDYMAQMYKARMLTGLNAEALAGLHSAAQKSGVSFEALTNGLVKFESSVMKAAAGSTTQLKAFSELGISQKDLVAGQTNLLPLLAKTMDGFHNNASAVQKAALARDLFSKGGPALLELLSKGSEYLRENTEAAKKALGVTNASIDAAHQFVIAQKILKEQTEALDLTIGRAGQGFRTWRGEVELTILKLAAMRSSEGSWNPFKNWIDKWRETQAELQKEMDASSKAGDEADKPKADDSDPAKGAKIKEAAEDYRGLSSVLESLQTKIAANGSEWDRVVQEASKYYYEINKATEELKKLQAEGKVTAESFDRESSVLARLPKMITQLQDEAWSKIIEQQVVAGEKQTEVADNVHRELLDKLNVYDSADYNAQRAKLQKDMDAYKASLEAKTKLTAEEYAMLAQITADGLSKINKAQTNAFAAELGKLTQHLEADLAATMSGEQKLYMEYQKAAEQYGQMEEQKALKTAQTEAEAATIREFYARIQTQLLQKYQQDLNTLKNSQGWEGIFGSKFGQDLRNNQQLLHQWATASNQSLLMVQVSLENLKEMGQKAFQGLAQGMGSAIADSLVYSKSIKQAMEAALASTLESIASQCITYAIYSAALGFLRLAEGDPAGSASAFTAAAIFGTVGAASAVAGRELTPAQGAAGGSGGGGGAGGGGGYGSGSAGSGGGQQQQPYVQLNVSGSLIGANGPLQLAQQIADIMNQAVSQNGVQLYASHNPYGVPLS